MPPIAPPRAVNLADRLWDATAVFLIGGGVGLFAYARSALQSMAAGTYDLPPGVSAVAQTDLHVTQSRLGLWLVAVGVIVGVVAALRHRMRPR